MALLARLAEAAHSEADNVELGFHEPSTPAGVRLPSARFRPAGIIDMPTREGDRRDVQVESAVALGLPRWAADREPPRRPRWLLRRTPRGLDLIAPKRLVFTRGRLPVPYSWRMAALTHGLVLVTYGQEKIAAAVIPYLDSV